MKITMEEAQEFTVFPADSILLAKIERVTAKEREGDRGTWTALEWEFKVLDVIASGDPSKASKEALMDGVGQSIWGSCSARLTDSPTNKLRAWVEAAFDMKLSVGFQLDTELLEGRTVKVVTSQFDKKFKDPATGLPIKGHRVEALLPAGDSTVPAAAADPWARPAADAWGAPPF